MVRLAVPVVVVQVGLMLMGVVDTVMVGHLSKEALAAVTLGNIYVFSTAVIGMGVLMVIDPVVAQAVGAGDEPAIARGVQRGLLLAVLLSIPGVLFLLPGEVVLGALRQPADVVPLAAQYTRATLPGFLPFLAFIVFRQTLQAMNRLAAIVWIVVAGNLVNVALNYAFIYGHFGAPALGVVGSGWATAVGRTVLGAGILVLAWRDLRPTLIPFRREVLEWAPLLRMLRVGAPIAVTMSLEYGAFAVVGVMMGWLGTTQMAGHQVALNLASLTFMVPLGVSGAGAVLVGQAIGRGDPDGMRRAAGAALILGVGFMAGTAVLFLLLPGPLAALYTGDPGVYALAASLIPIAGLFQVFDGTQAVTVGILRGAGDTSAPMIINVLGFWLVGIPVSRWFGFGLGWGPVGLWWGFVAGLAAVALFLVLRLRTRFRRTVERLVIDRRHSAELPVA
ncbi:MAG TPA: MATE family efflux transporter [Gemmatimonadales bacterium]|jgi:MATE family multidrug resistance protein|nr:MATE family efflux transporter [Gemmatimonadales bacterium]